MHRVLLGTSRKCGRNIKTRCIGVDIKHAQKKGFKIERNHPSWHAPSLLYPEGYHDGNWRNHKRESICVTSTSSEDFLQRTSGWKNWFQKLLEAARTPNESNQRPKNQIVRTGRPVLSEQQSGSSVQEIENVSNLAAKAPIKEHGDLLSSCVPVSVKRLDQDKDADENIDADHVPMKVNNPSVCSHSARK